MASNQKRLKKTDQFTDIWEILENGVASILESKELSPFRYMELYTKAYDYVNLARTPDKSAHPKEYIHAIELNRRPLNSQFIARTGDKGVHLQNKHRDELGRKLTKCFETFLLKFTKELGSLHGGELIKKYYESWEEFSKNAQVINGIFGNVNRYWIHNSIEEKVKLEEHDRCKLYQVYQLALNAWRNIVLGTKNNEVVTRILDGYTNDRSNLPICDRNLLRNAIFSLVTLGTTKTIREANGDSPKCVVDNKTGLNLTLDIYTSLFETSLIQLTTNYYTKMASDILDSSTSSFADYMNLISKELAKEEERAKFCLPPTGCQEIMALCHKFLIQDHLPRFQAEFSTYLKQLKLNELKLLFSLLTNVNTAHFGPFYELFTQHVLNEGETSVNEKRYIESLLETYQKYRQLISEAFANNNGFISALEKACAVFVNDNIVTKAVSRRPSELSNNDDLAISVSTKSAQFLAQYCDSFIRKSKNKSDYEKTVKNIMVIFAFLRDKDAFKIHYTCKLANRLIAQTSFNGIAEQVLLTKLKEANGYEYTSKMLRMYNDIEYSKELQLEFKEHLITQNISLAHDFQPFVLTSASWPFRCTSDFSLPSELEQSIQNFTTFYIIKHEGKKLSWLFNRSKGEISCNCFRGTSHLLQLSLYQMGVLLMYNNANEYKFEEILETTRLTHDVAIKVLKQFTDSNLLIQLPPSPKPMTGSTIFQLNLNYKNPKFRFSIRNSTTPTPDKISQDSKTQKTIRDNRMFVIQACIIRIMKMRRSLNHKELVCEVLRQVNKEFQPDEALIRKCITILIAKEYLERATAADGTTQIERYNYLT